MKKENGPVPAGRKIYGTLGKVGVAMPAGGYIAVTDFHRWLCSDIAISDCPVPLESVSPEGLKTFSEKVTETMHLYRDYDPVDLAFLSCTAGSQAGGPGYDAYLCRVIREAAGAREGYTTTTAVLKALEALGVRKLSICTPYPGDVNRMEKEYFENEGFTVAGIHGMETENPRDPKLIGRIPPDAVFRFARDHMDPGAEVMFLSCTGLTVMEIIDDLEKELGVPVITSNSCATWIMGRFFGRHGDRAEKLGELFRH